MGSELLIPGVQHHGETDLAAKVVSPEGQECVGGGAKQEVQQRAPVALAGQDERIQFMWQRKHVVEVRRRQQFPLAILDPGRLGQGLAFGTMPVAAAVVQMPLVATALAPLSVTAQGGRATMHDRPRYLELDRRGLMRAEVLVRIACKDVREVIRF